MRAEIAAPTTFRLVNGEWDKVQVVEVAQEDLTTVFTAQLPNSDEIIGLSDRGRLREGCAADLLLFDPATVGRGAKHRVFDLPGDAARLTTDALGLHGVWVNGRAGRPADGIWHLRRLPAASVHI